MNPLDVLDDLRPDTQHLDPATAERVWRRLTAQHPDLADTDTTNEERHSLARVRTDADVPHRATRRRSVALVGAAAAAVVGLVALGVVDRSGPDSPPATATQPSIASPPPSAVTPSSEPVVSPAETDESAATVVDQVKADDSTRDDLAAATGFVLPSFVPDGLEITGLEAGRNSMWDNPFGATRWAQVIDGSITKMLTVRAPRPIDPRDPEIDSDDTVRGTAAEIWAQDDVLGVSWNAEGHTHVATSTGLTEAEFLGAVEDLEIDSETSTVTLPDGGRSLGLVHESQLGVVGDDVVTSVVAIADPARPHNTVLHAVATPNTFGVTVDGFTPEQPGWETRTVDGVDMRIRVHPADEGGGNEVRWVDHDVRYQVYGTTDTDTAIEFARGLTLTDAATFKAAVAELTDRATAEMMAWIELDRVTFDDGISATIRSRTEGSGADAICIEAPVEQCSEQVSEASLADGYSDNVFDTFDINGRNVVIGWQSTSEAERLGEPTIEPGDAVDPADGLSLTTTATLDQLARGTTGRFLEIEVPAGERPPQLIFRSGDNVLHAAPPASRSAYES